MGKTAFSLGTVVLADKEGQHAMEKLKDFLKQDGLIFRSKRGGPLVENSILVQGLHPALKKIALPKADASSPHPPTSSSAGSLRLRLDPGAYPSRYTPRPWRPHQRRHNIVWS